MMVFPKPSAQAKLEEVERELAMRRDVYPRWVRDRKMSQQRADYQIHVMEAIRDGRWPTDRAQIKGLAYRDGDEILATPAASTVKDLSKMPSKPELLSSMLGTMNAVPTNFVSLLANVPRGFLNVLTALKDQKAGEEAA